MPVRGELVEPQGTPEFIEGHPSTGSGRTVFRERSPDEIREDCAVLMRRAPGLRFALSWLLKVNSRNYALNSPNK